MTKLFYKEPFWRNEAQPKIKKRREKEERLKNYWILSTAYEFLIRSDPHILYIKHISKWNISHVLCLQRLACCSFYRFFVSLQPLLGNLLPSVSFNCQRFGHGGFKCSIWDSKHSGNQEILTSWKWGVCENTESEITRDRWQYWYPL